MNNKIFYIGITIFIGGILFLIYSVNAIKKDKEESVYGTGVLIEGFVFSVFLIIGGLICIFKNI